MFQLCRLTQGFKQVCGSICCLGVFVEAPAVFCQKQSVGKNAATTTSAGTQSILNPSRSTSTHTTTSHLYTNLNSDNIQQTQINTRRKKKLQPFLSARDELKFAFFKLSHLALRTFCHAPAGICEQLPIVRSSSCVNWLNASSKSAAPSAASGLPKHLQCFVTIGLSKTRWDSD